MRRYIRNTSYSFLLYILQMMATIIVTPFIIKNLGKENYGIFVAINALSAFGWFSIMDLGLQGALARFLAKTFRDGVAGRDAGRDYVQAATIFFFFCGCVSGITAFILSSHPELFTINAKIASITSEALLLVGIFNFILFPLFTIPAIAEGLQDYKLLKLTGIVIIIVWALVVMLLVRLRANVLMFMLIEYLKVVIQYVVVWLLLKKKVPWLYDKIRFPPFSEIRKVTSLSFDILIGKITGLVFNQTDVLIITFLAGRLMLVTDYYSANTIFMAIIAITGVFNSAVVSETTWLNEDSYSLQELAITGCRLTATIVLPMAAIIFVWAPDILSAWLGNEYRSNAYLLRVFMVAVIPVVSTGVITTMLVGLNKIRASLWISGLSVLINLFISIAGFHTLGIIALGIGTTVAYCIGGILYSRYCLNILKLTLREFYLKALMLPLLIGLSYLILGFAIKSVIAINGLAYLLLVVIVSYIICLLTTYIFSPKDARGHFMAVIGVRIANS